MTYYKNNGYLESVVGKLQDAEQNTGYQHFHATILSVFRRVERTDAVFTNFSSFNRKELLQNLVCLNLNLRDISALLLQIFETHKKHLYVSKKELQNISTDIFRYERTISTSSNEISENTAKINADSSEVAQINIRCNSVLCRIEKDIADCDSKILRLKDIDTNLIKIGNGLFSFRRYFIGMPTLQKYREDTGKYLNTLADLVTDLIFTLTNNKGV